MPDDARISTALPNHPKTIKLKRRLRERGCWSLVCLFLWVASERPDGKLTGLSDEDIEIAAQWEGKPGAFVSNCYECGFIDKNCQWYEIHDWSEHNPWAANRGKRVEAARYAANKKWQGVAEAMRNDAERMRSASDSQQSAMPTTQPNPTQPTTTEEAAGIGLVTAKPKRKKFDFSGYKSGVTEVVNYLNEKWPEVRPGDKSPIRFNNAAFADRVDALIQQGFSVEQLKSIGDKYLAEPNDWPSCPHFFFGPGKPNGSGANNYLAYAKMLIHEQSKVVTH